MRNSIRARLIIAFIGLAVVPLLLVGIILAFQEFSTQRTQVLTIEDQISLRGSIQVSDLFSTLENELQLAIKIRGFKGLTTDQQKSVLSGLLIYRNAFDDIYLLDNKGQELVGVARGGIVTASDLASRAQKDEFTSPMADGKTYYSPVHVESATGQPVITLSLPVVDLQTGQTENILVADLRFQIVQDLVSTMETTENGLIYVLDSQGKVVAHRDPSVVLKDIHFNAPSEDGIYPGLDGTNAVIATDTIALGKQNLVVVAETPATEALALATNTLMITAILILFTLAIAIGIGLFVVRRLLRPIGVLAEAAQAIRVGDFSKQVPVTTDDEIGQLGRTFNDMVTAIQQREGDLREQAAELRVATAKARESARVKGEFLANISHELRTPLNAIIGFSDMLLMGMSGALNQQQTHKITRLRENGNRLLSLINNVLDLTRIEARRIELVEKPFYPNVLAERLSAQMEILAQQKDLELRTVVSPDLPRELLGDEQRIEQIVVNLLSNAFKFTEKGSVTLDIGSDASAQKWHIVVSDTGIGIPPHALDLIFEEFRQVDGTSVRAFKGSGLGLAITRNLVRIMEGQITVKSDMGIGSVFTVILPLHQNKAVAEPMLEKVGL